MIGPQPKSDSLRSQGLIHLLIYSTEIYCKHPLCVRHDGNTEEHQTKIFGIMYVACAMLLPDPCLLCLSSNI